MNWQAIRRWSVGAIGAYFLWLGVSGAIAGSVIAVPAGRGLPRIVAGGHPIHFWLSVSFFIICGGLLLKGAIENVGQKKRDRKPWEIEIK